MVHSHLQPHQNQGLLNPYLPNGIEMQWVIYAMYHLYMHRKELLFCFAFIKWKIYTVTESLCNIQFNYLFLTIYFYPIIQTVEPFAMVFRQLSVFLPSIMRYTHFKLQQFTHITIRLVKVLFHQISWNTETFLSEPQVHQEAKLKVCMRAHVHT